MYGELLDSDHFVLNDVIFKRVCYTVITFSQKKKVTADYNGGYKIGLVLIFGPFYDLCL